MPEDVLSVWMNLGKHSLFVWLYVWSVKTTDRNIRLDKLSSVVRLVLETNNQTNNECLPKLVQTDNAPSSIKTAIVGYSRLWDTQSEFLMQKEIYETEISVHFSLNDRCRLLRSQLKNWRMAESRKERWAFFLWPDKKIRLYLGADRTSNRLRFFSWFCISFDCQNQTFPCAPAICVVPK